MSTDHAHHSYHYDDLFYKYLTTGSARSASALLPYVIDPLGVKSVLDIGCGTGAWLVEYEKHGVSDHIGVDGDYVDRSQLLISDTKFLPHDIRAPFELGRQFDLVQCLEVGEHVPTAASTTLVDNIVRHGKRVIFSAAVPGQGGKEHINEQPYAFWRKLFAERGFRLYDYIRPHIQTEYSIEPWYRYNIFFYCHDDAIKDLPLSVTASHVPEDMSVRDYSPTSYRARKAIMRMLPNRAVSTLATLKHNLIVRFVNRG